MMAKVATVSKTPWRVSGRSIGLMGILGLLIGGQLAPIVFSPPALRLPLAKAAAYAGPQP